MITFSCAGCQAKLQIKEELSGKRIRCPHCKRVEEVPLQSQPQASISEGDTLPPTPRRTCAPEEAVPRPTTSPTGTNGHGESDTGDREAEEIVQGVFAYKVGGE